MASGEWFWASIWAPQYSLFWFTLIFAPVIAGITAYHVYHTLALPHDPYNKAKRKEKNTLALEDHEQESLSDLSDIPETQALHKH